MNNDEIDAMKVNGSVFLLNYHNYCYKMKLFPLNLIFILVALPLFSFAQVVEFEAKAKISIMDTVLTGNSLVVRQDDGILAIREGPSLSISNEGDTLYLDKGNWIIIPGISPIRDIDGNVYTTTKIGAQEWMVENLKTTKYSDGTPIPFISDSTSWKSLTTPAYCWLNNDSLMYAERYGALYNYYVVADSSSKKVCPVGWQIPTDSDWTILKDYLSGHGHSSQEGKALKDTANWVFNAEHVGIDYYRFKALPAAYRDIDGSFGDNGYINNLWSNTNNNDSTAWFRNLHNASSAIARYWGLKRFGFSVRCLRD